jgi:hypothetical protein
MRLLTIGEAADLLEEVEPGVGADYLLRQLRRFVQLGLVVPAGYRGDGRTAPACSTPAPSAPAGCSRSCPGSASSPACSATRSAACATTTPGGPLEPGAPAGRPYGFDGAVEAVLAGEPLFLCLKADLRPRGPGDEAGGFSGGIFGPETLVGGGLPRLPSPAAIVLDCGQLFGPVLRRLAAEPSPEPDAAEPPPPPPETEE